MFAAACCTRGPSNVPFLSLQCVQTASVAPWVRRARPTQSWAVASVRQDPSPAVTHWRSRARAAGMTGPAATRPRRAPPSARAAQRRRALPTQWRPDVVRMGAAAQAARHAQLEAGCVLQVGSLAVAPAAAPLPFTPSSPAGACPDATLTPCPSAASPRYARRQRPRQGDSRALCRRRGLHPQARGGGQIGGHRLPRKPVRCA
jgi:hypothetical protein